MSGTGSNDTIFAPATGAGVAGIAVIRISGPAARAMVARFTSIAEPTPRLARRVRFSDPADGRSLDDGLVIWFPGPDSYTGEDVAEFHIHGGRATISAFITALGREEGARLAEAGEFTRRAFDNEKLDLTGVEGLADLIAAETEMQRRQALRQLGGELGAYCEDWRHRLIGILAELEAWIDFPDEDLPEGLYEQGRYKITVLLDEISQHLGEYRPGERIRDGLAIVIAGPPNVGKSSLLNYLARRDAAIVSEQAGTTRDIIAVQVDMAGFPVTFYDTAGLREGADAIEAEGIRRAIKAAEGADFCLLLEAPDCPGLAADGIAALSGPGDRDIVRIRNKLDLETCQTDDGSDNEIIGISLKTGAGTVELLAAIEAVIRERFDLAGPPPLTRERHRAALEECRASLRAAGAGEEIELIAEDLRSAARSLGRITGRVDIESILDRLFAEFCIGK